MKIGVIGCGNISGIYFENGRKLKDLDIVTCSDLDMAKAKAQAEKYGVPKVCTVDELLADKSIEAVLNLTIPHAHAPVALQAIAAGKHVYGEKPLAVTREAGKKIIDAAKKKKLRVGSAPDTFLGGAIQTCVKLINDGAIGQPVAASAFMLCHGHETWHPNPDFYYQPGGGPMFDMGPYYLTALVALLGPARRVCGSTGISFPERTITSQPKNGQIIKVNTPTHLAGTIDFANGAIATMITSFDVYGHHLPNIEIYGTEGSMTVPDPNSFGMGRDAVQPIRVWSTKKREWTEMSYTHGYQKNSRGVGLADMARAIKTGRDHRASGETAFHVLDIMQAFIDSSEQGKHIALKSTCKRPAPFPVGLADGDIDD